MPKSDSALAPIGLSEFVYQVKRELMQPDPDSDSPRILSVEDIELEIQVSATRGLDGGLTIQVLKIGGSAKQQDTHTVRVKLQPLLSHDQRLAELQKDPRYAAYAAATVDHTLKGFPARKRLDD
jgi:Trypsin-co-occurring domain 2